MTIKTFDANRVGGGTFQIKQDPLTGDYSVEEVGFVKLPELKLPEIDQAAYTVPDLTPDDPTGEDPTEPGTDTGTGGGGSGGGGGGNQQDFTGASMFKNIQDEATGGSDNLMQDATTFAGQDTGIQVENLTKNPEENTALLAYNQSLKLYNDAIAKADTKNPNEMKNVDEAKALVNRNRKFYEQSVAPGALFFEGNIPDRSIGDFSFTGNPPGQTLGPRTVPTGTLTGGLRGVPDMIVQGQPALPDQNVFSKAKDVVSNSKPVQLIGAGIRMAGEVLGAALPKSDPTPVQQVNNRLFTTRGDMGSTVDSQRIVGDPTKDLYAGMNRTSAYGNLEKAGNKRIETRTNTINRRGIKDKAYADANGLKYDPNGMSADFHRNTEGMKDQAAKYKREKEAAIDTSPGATGGEGGGGEGPDSGKSIVCTAMYQTTGLQDWAKAMKIWYIYQKRYLTIQHQEGYHKLFKPFVKAMHKSNIIKSIGAHFAKHRTQHLKHVMFNSKPSLLGKIYNKILEPICYWAGRK